jgi:putative transposase
MLVEIGRHATDKNAAIVAAYAMDGYSYQQLADHFGVHFMTVGKIVRGSK